MQLGGRLATGSPSVLLTYTGKVKEQGHEVEVALHIIDAVELGILV